MGKLWEAFGGKDADNWLLQVITAPALYTLVGLGAWIQASGWAHSGARLAAWFTTRSGTEQGLLAIGALLAATTVGSVVNGLVPVALRGLEGYWPGYLRRLSQLIAKRHAKRFVRRDKRLKELGSEKSKRDLTTSEANEFVSIDLKLRRIPVQPSEWMPTRLGNTLRAAESWPRDKYGLDAAVVWPRLWLLLPSSIREEIGDARARLDQSIAGWVWGLLLVLWATISWWPVVLAAAVALFFYRRATAAAEIYGDLVEAAFDLERVALYRQLRISLPANSGVEPDQGAALTQYLWRGLGSIKFTE